MHLTTDLIPNECCGKQEERWTTKWLLSCVLSFQLIGIIFDIELKSDQLISDSLYSHHYTFMELSEHNTYYTEALDTFCSSKVTGVPLSFTLLTMRATWRRHTQASIRHRNVTCNRIISMSTRSRFRVLNHDQNDHHANSMAFIVVMCVIQSPRSYVITSMTNCIVEVMLMWTKFFPWACIQEFKKTLNSVSCW